MTQPVEKREELRDSAGIPIRAQLREAASQIEDAMRGAGLPLKDAARSVCFLQNLADRDDLLSADLAAIEQEKRRTEEVECDLRKSQDRCVSLAGQVDRAEAERAEAEQRATELEAVLLTFDALFSEQLQGENLDEDILDRICEAWGPVSRLLRTSSPQTPSKSVCWTCNATGKNPTPEES